MNVLTETVISSPEAAKILHVRTNAIRDWARKGSSGIKLEAVFVGRTLKTSKEAVARFLQAVDAKRRGGTDATT